MMGSGVRVPSAAPLFSPIYPINKKKVSELLLLSPNFPPFERCFAAPTVRSWAAKPPPMPSHCPRHEGYRDFARFAGQAAAALHQCHARFAGCRVAQEDHSTLKARNRRVPLGGDLMDSPLRAGVDAVGGRSHHQSPSARRSLQCRVTLVLLRGLTYPRLNLEGRSIGGPSSLCRLVNRRNETSPENLENRPRRLDRNAARDWRRSSGVPAEAPFEKTSLPGHHRCFPDNEHRAVW